MPTRPLPERPNLRHFKNQARDLLRAGDATSLAEARFRIAQLYGFTSWARLNAWLEARTSSEASAGEIAALRQAIDTNDFESMKTVMKRAPELHRAPLGYGKHGPLTWVAECRVPWEAPGAVRLAMARWMMENGSDVHQGSDAPLGRAALFDERIPMMELLVSLGANVNAVDGYGPLIFSPCETLNPGSLKWLLHHGANPNPDGETALDMVLGSYFRSPKLGACIEVLVNAGGRTRHDPVIVELLRGHLDLLAQRLDADASLMTRQFPKLDIGATGTRRLTLNGAMLLHVAAEYGSVEAVRLLLDRGAGVNARAAVDAEGIGGQTAVFHSATQRGDWGFEVTQLLVERGADLSIRVKLPGHYERLDEVVECTPLEYAARFPGEESKTVAFLRDK